MNAPCARWGLPDPRGWNSISPLPSSRSAPAMSKMVRESTWELTAKEMRDGTFALISPVMTSTDGRWVAMMRYMPAALAI